MRQPQEIGDGQATFILEIRPTRAADAAELATLLNEIIARGGTTAFEDAFTADAIADAMITGPDVVCCFVATTSAPGALSGFQSVERRSQLPGGVGDIATFTRVGSTQRGVGSSLFAATRATAAAHGLVAIDAMIRADNLGGLAFYDRM